MHFLLHTFFEADSGAGVKDLAKVLAADPRVLIIGVGNEYRSDDAVGLLVARRLRELTLNNARVVEESGEGARLMKSWRDVDNVILLDAVFSGAKPGTIHRFDARVQRMPRDIFRYSTHAFGVGEAIELARELDQLPPRVLVCGIEGKNFERGMRLSSEVDAVQEVMELLLRENRSA